MKRVLALLCVIALVFTLCSCRKTKVETSEFSYYEDGASAVDNKTEDDASDGDASASNKNESYPKTNSVISNPLSADLKGATVTVYDAGGVFTPNASASKTDAARAKLISKLQKELNCKLDVKSSEIEKLMSLSAASAASGKAVSQIIASPLYKMGYFIGSNLVADMDKISSMDLSKSYMNAAGMLEATRFGNGRYGVAADGTSGSCVLYNKRILKELGYPDNYIYSLVDSGNWNYTEFRKLAKEATKELDGKPGMSEADQWGMVVMDMETGVTADLLVSANTPMLKFSGGELVSNMSNANIAKVANLLVDTYKNDGTRLAKIAGTNATGKKAHEAFKTGRVFMEYTVTSAMDNFTTMKDEFGVVPTPKFDDASEYSSSFDWNYKGIMIPAGLSAKDQYNAGAVVQAYMYLMQDIYNVKKNEYNNRYFCDTESGENFIKIVNGVTTHPVQCYAQANEQILTGTYRVFWNYISKGASVSAAVESTSSSLKSALNDLNAKIKDK